MPAHRDTISIALLALAASLAAAEPPAPQEACAGRLVERTVHGDSLEGNLLGIAADRSVTIYLPPSYAGSKRRYPSLYVLHGIMDTPAAWTRPWGAEHPGYATIQDLMDRGACEGALREMILVIPDSEKSCHYTDSPVKGNWERFIVRDLVAFVDANYRTIPRAASRGIMGHSMGGHGAIKIGMKHPDTFSVVYGLNPSMLGWGGDVGPGNPAFRTLAEMSDPGGIGENDFYAHAIVGIGRCFAPNKEAPFLTDLPFAPDGDALVPASPGHEGWVSHMPLYMIPRYAEDMRTLRGLRFDSGFEDEFSHIPVTARAFSQALEEHGIEHVFEMYNGDHRNRLWGRDGRLYTEVLPYFSARLSGGAGAD